MLASLLTVATGLAQAAAPAGIDAEDPTTYDAVANTLRHGPDGCWEVVGQASWSWNLGRRRGHARGDAAFIGRLEDGVWRDFVVRSLGEDIKELRQTEVRVFDHDSPRFLPLVGRFRDARVDDDDDGYGDNVITAVIGRLGTDVSYSWSEWSDDEDAVLLHRKIPFKEGDREATMDVAFPGGEPYPTELTIAFPESFGVPGFRIAKVKDAVAKVRARKVDTLIFPEAETFSFEVGVFGFQATAAQTIRYQTFRPCGGDTADTAKAIGGK